MRRPAAALLGTLAGTVLLVGAKYGSASPAADTVAADDPGAGAPGTDPSGDGSAAGGSPVPGGSGTSAGPGRNPTTAAAPGAGATTPGRATTGAAPTTATCTTASGSASRIASPGVGTVTVTIQVCGGTLKTSSAVQSQSNWDTNTAAIPALNKLAVANYRTNFAAIHYSRATLTSGSPWHIPVTHPWDVEGTRLVLAASDLGVATSGTYERGFHVVDPRTGEPARALRSVTVVGPDLGVADAYATAAVAMGRGALRWLAELAERSAYNAAVVTEDGEAFCSAGLPVVPITGAMLDNGSA